MHTEEFYDSLIEQCNNKFKCKFDKNVEIQLPSICLERIKNILCFFIDNGYYKFAKELFVNIMKKPNLENGFVYEALVYSWLVEHKISFLPQCHIDKDLCLKENSYIADGKIDDIVFDIKKFGVVFAHFEKLRMEIQKRFPDSIIIISGNWDIDLNRIEKTFLAKVPTIVDELKMEKNRVHTDYFYTDSNITIRRCNEWSGMGFSDFNPYKWAQENQYCLMKDASQFCDHSPYILMCPLDSNGFFAKGDGETIFQRLRPLCRQMFMGLTKVEKKLWEECDGKAKKNVTIAEAAKKISAIAFLDVTTEWDYNNNRMWVFCNPNADYELKKYKVDTLFRNFGAYVEDFRYDNY